ncbi:MAG: radical SAM protein [Thermoprotei archaeon]
MNSTNEFKVKTIYGPHPSRCFGLVLGIDPLGLPKRCVYNCISCPLTIKTLVKTVKPLSLISPEDVIRDLDMFINLYGKVFKRIVIWGLGDPLLNYNTPLITREIKSYLNKAGIDVPISLRTTGYLLLTDWAKPLLEYVDSIIIPVSAPSSLRRTLVDPAPEAKYSIITKNISSLEPRYREKISIEVTLYKTTGFSNATYEVLEELIADISRLRVDKILLKTVNRPSPREELKPVRGKLFERIREKFENEGYNVMTCTETQLYSLRISPRNWLLNHLIRKPLNTLEISSIYGVEGVAFAETLSSKGLLDKVTWEKSVYFRPRVKVLMHRGIGIG